jgi:hypothetical protein
LGVVAPETLQVAIDVALNKISRTRIPSMEDTLFFPVGVNVPLVTSVG